MEYSNEKIILDKELNNLDLFVLKFINEWKKFSEYVLVSGYVSILLGRSRISEDIDILVPKMNFEKFEKISLHLNKKFWCLNGDDVDELYSLLGSGHSIRFAEKNKVVPNMEIKFINKNIDRETFRNKIEVRIGQNSLFISPIECQIIYKEEVLKSPKDKEDALHLREILKESLDAKKFKYFEELIKQDEV